MRGGSISGDGGGPRPAVCVLRFHFGRKRRGNKVSLFPIDKTEKNEKKRELGINTFFFSSEVSGKRSNYREAAAV